MFKFFWIFDDSSIYSLFDWYLYSNTVFGILFPNIFVYYTSSSFMAQSFYKRIFVKRWPNIGPNLFCNAHSHNCTLVYCFFYWFGCVYQLHILTIRVFENHSITPELLFLRYFTLLLYIGQSLFVFAVQALVSDKISVSVLLACFNPEHHPVVPPKADPRRLHGTPGDPKRPERFNGSWPWVLAPRNFITPSGRCFGWRHHHSWWHWGPRWEQLILFGSYLWPPFSEAAVWYFPPG